MNPSRIHQQDSEGHLFEIEIGGYPRSDPVYVLTLGGFQQMSRRSLNLRCFDFAGTSDLILGRIIR